MRKVKNSIIAIICACIGVTTIGCSIGEKSLKSNSSKEVTLKVMTNRVDIVDTDLKSFGDEYKKKTGVNIEWEAIQDYDAEMQVRIRANDNYGDVLIIPGISSNEYEEYLEPLGKASDNDISQYTINKEFATKDDNGDYTVYGLSYGVGAQGIVYNKKVFKDAGIDIESMKTFEGFYDGCRKLKEIGVTPVATNFKDSWTLKYWYISAKCISGQADFENKLYKEESIFNKTKPMGQILDFSGTLINEGWVEEDLLFTDWESSKQKLADGEVAMMFLGTWIISQEQALADNPEDIGFMPIPTQDGITYTYLEADYSLGISNKSKYKKEARDFLFAFNESDYAYNNGLIPNNKNLEKVDPVIEEFLNSGVNQLIEETADEEDSGKTSEVFEKSGIDKVNFVQKPFIYSVTGKDKLDNEINKLNEKWNNAKKEIG